VIEEDGALLLVNHGSTVHCQIVELSLGGCRISTQERFMAGIRVRVEVSFKVRGLAFRFSGVTQWTDGKHLVGVRFVDIPSRRIEELAEALSEVEAENAIKAKKLAAEMRAQEEKAAADADIACEGQTQHKKPGSEPSTERGTGKLFGAESWGFSPDIRPTESTGGFRPRGMLPGNLPAIRPFSAASQATPALKGFPAKAPQPEPLRTSFPTQSRQSAGFTQVSMPTSSGLPEKAESKRVEPEKPEQKAIGQPSPKPIKRERRQQTRQEVDTSAVIYLINVGSKPPGRIRDLSMGGCHIRTDERLPVGIYTRVETEFRLEGLPFRLGGVIQAIHDRERVNVGIRFLDMSERKRDQVAQLIEEIEEMRERRKLAESNGPTEPAPQGSQ
jgi:c-di-GMP-binding flagellar brake protein YcgR